MKLVIFTIVLDGMPWIPWHLPTFNRLDLDWEWHVMEGVAAPMHCTRWCAPMSPRLSTDGTTEYLDSIRAHPRVKIHRQPIWDGKVAMVDVPMAALREKSVVMQVDVDELWLAGQIESIVWLLKSGQHDAAEFTCRYFLGPNIAITRRGHYGNKAGEWLRAWVASPGQRFTSHEPPRMAGGQHHVVPHQLTENHRLIFDHYAYATEAQLRFKERYYRYAGAVEAWKRLQANTRWPAQVKEFLPWVRDGAIADVVNPNHTTP